MPSMSAKCLWKIQIVTKHQMDFKTLPTKIHLFFISISFWNIFVFHLWLTYCLHRGRLFPDFTLETWLTPVILSEKSLRHSNTRSFLLQPLLKSLNYEDNLFNLFPWLFPPAKLHSLSSRSWVDLECLLAWQYSSTHHSQNSAYTNITILFPQIQSKNFLLIHHKTRFSFPAVSITS